MSSARQVKRCPQCGTMTFTETTACQTCGHQFRSEGGEPQPTYNPERTQMLTLPAATLRAAHEAQAQQESAISYIEPTLPKKASQVRVVVLPIIIVLLLVGLFFLLIH